MSIQASALFDAFRQSGLLLEMAGGDVAIERVSCPEACSSGSLVFVDREAFVKPALDGGATVVITDSALSTAFAKDPGPTIITTADVKLARALVTQRFFDRELQPAGIPHIDPSAVVADSARIGAHVYVGAGARVGEDTVILANAVVEERAVIGDRTVIHPGVVIGFECEIGSDVVIRAGTIIGSDGFGFAQDEKHRSHRIPHLGNVVIEDRVVVGANCCIDRGSHDATRIGSGTIMDNLCHIAHSVQIGENCILTAMFCVAGSTRIGKRVMTSGQAGILDHLTIADDVALVQRAGVDHDVRAPGVYAGLPLMPLKDFLKSQAGVRRLAATRSTIKDLEKRVAALESESTDR